MVGLGLAYFRASVLPRSPATIGTELPFPLEHSARRWY